MDHGIGILSLGCNVPVVIGLPLLDLFHHFMPGIAALFHIPLQFPFLFHIVCRVDIEGEINERTEGTGIQGMQAFQDHDFGGAEQDRPFQCAGRMVVHHFLDCRPLLQGRHVLFEPSEIICLGRERGDIPFLPLFPVEEMVVVKGDGRDQLLSQQLPDRLGEAGLP